GGVATRRKRAARQELALTRYSYAVEIGLRAPAAFRPLSRSTSRRRACTPMLAPLARLIAQAAERTQVWVVTHSERLAQSLTEQSGVASMTVIKRAGETWIDGLRLGGGFADEDRRAAPLTRRGDRSPPRRCGSGSAHRRWSRGRAPPRSCTPRHSSRTGRGAPRERPAPSAQSAYRHILRRPPNSVSWLYPVLKLAAGR